MADTSTFDKEKIQAFIDEWSQSKGAERSNAQHFLLELIDLLGADRPPKDVEASQEHCFEKALKVVHRDGHESTNFIDYYKRDHFVLEAKQGSESGDKAKGTAVRGTTGWDKAMRAAFGQARSYSAHLPEGRPPFLITVDVGFCFEVWSGFSGTYGGYGARDTYYLEDLARPEVFDFFVKVFTDPQELNPYAKAARVTREVAEHLAELGKALEEVPYTAQEVAAFLMRCIFTMFAEDVGLLPAEVFTTALRERWMKKPQAFAEEVEDLWATMDAGGKFGFERILKFNGGLFSSQQGIPLNAEQLELLLEAAERDWAQVEPSIFGTLLERALDPVERHSLGAHFTPRAYIERLVRPTVIEPVREEWEAVQAQARQLVETENGSAPKKGDVEKAIKALRDFHTRICKLRILDPACGTGNFLYVTFDLLKEVEEEVLRELADLGDRQVGLELGGVTVNPSQFLGIEKNPRAREIADLVLWIGYLQWYQRSRGNLDVPEPVLHAYKNIECRDAILAWDGDPVPRVGEDGKPITVWDMRTYKTDPVTGEQVPDEQAQAPVLDYPNARQADPWPAADYIVSNPPFVGNKVMRQALGDGYVETLRRVWKEVPGSADLVMYWWERSAQAVAAGKLHRFGLITTNSISQTFNRKVLEKHLGAKKNPLAVAWAIADHPWVNRGADVRIGMTVGCLTSELTEKPRLGTVEGDSENPHVSLRAVDAIHADLSGGPNIAGAVRLKSNSNLSYQGMVVVGMGFCLDEEEIQSLGYDSEDLPKAIASYVNARDLTRGGENRYVIDLFGLSESEAAERHPALFQRALDRVKPARMQSKRKSFREAWWIFGWPRPVLRTSVSDLTRFIVTPKTAKHRIFLFLDTQTIPDSKLYCFASSDAYIHGVLSSRLHVLWSTSAGANLGVGNDPTYNNKECFDPFPFPAATESQQQRIREIAEKLDAHRKKVQADYPKAHLTNQYNALERLRELERGEGEPLSKKERDFHQKALIGILKSLHDDLDRAVADAYGWPHDLEDEEILQRLVDLNAERAAEEEIGLIRWLRPEFQDPDGEHSAQQVELDVEVTKPKARVPKKKRKWPKDPLEQLQALRGLLAGEGGSWSVEEAASAFKGARRKSVGRHLEALENLGVLISYEDGGVKRWSARLPSG